MYRLTYLRGLVERLGQSSAILTDSDCFRMVGTVSLDVDC